MNLATALRLGMLKVLLAVGVVVVGAQPSPDHARQMAESRELFAAEVRPFLQRNCLECHGGKKVKSGLNIATRETLLKGGDLGVAVIPGSGGDSRFVKVLTREEEPYMPPKKPRVSGDHIEAVSRWIDLGAAYDQPLAEVPETTGPMQVTDDDRAYWAFRPLKKPAVPDGVDHPVDAFVRRKLTEKKLPSVGEADRHTLIRRACFDLIGLPPEPEMVSAFVAANDVGGAWSEAIDELLASSHYGERWARHWLDPARFGESHGFEHDTDRSHAYHFRDFVIQALNRDMPYDQFVQWQIAGDELAPTEPLALMATGFLGAGVYPTQITTREAERVRYDAMDDMLATTGHAVLGLTIGCARCHDHKYDPIPVRDYYELLSTFTTTVRSEIDVDFGTEAEQAAMRAFEKRRTILENARQTIEEGSLLEEVRHFLKEGGKVPEGKAAEGAKKLLGGKEVDKIPDEQWRKLASWFGQSHHSGWRKVNDALLAHEKIKPKETRKRVQVCTEGRKPMRLNTADGSIRDFYEPTYHLARGDANQKGKEADQGFLQVLTRHPEGKKHWIVTKPEGATTSFRRSGLANWLTDHEHGAGHLAARVMVNRVWHHHFGRGIVSSINDFGFQGELPTHPELLDWLAADFIEHGWKLKRLHRLIMTSRTYQMASVGEPDEEQLRYFGTYQSRRVEAEVIRDSLLAVGGLLDRTMFGPGTLDESMKRRSLYFRVKRSQLIPFLQVFDWPDSLTSAGVRSTTTVAPQALLFLNNPEVKAYADGFAKRLEPLADRSGRITRAYEMAFSRPPAESELREGEAYLDQHSLADYCLVLMSLNEFVYTP